MAPKPKTIYNDEKVSVVLSFHQKSYESLIAEGHEEKMNALTGMITKNMPLIMRIIRQKGYNLREGKLKIEINNEKKTKDGVVVKGVYTPDEHTIYIGEAMWLSWKNRDFDKMLRFVVFVHEFGHSLGTRNGIFSWFKGEYGEEEYSKARNSFNDIVEFLRAGRGRVTRRDIGKYLRERIDMPKRHRDMIWHYTMIPVGRRGLGFNWIEEGIDNLMARFISLELTKLNPKMSGERLKQALSGMYPEITVYVYLISKLVGTDKFLRAYASGDFSMVKDDFFKTGVFRDERDFIIGIQNPRVTCQKIRSIFGDKKINGWLNEFSPETQEKFRKKVGWAVVR